MKTKVFIGNLPDGVNEYELKGLFEAFGQLKEFDILSNYGFVHFINEEDAAKAVNELNGYPFQGAKIRVELSVPKDKSKGPRGASGSGWASGWGHGGGNQGGGFTQKKTKIYIGNIPDTVTRDELHKMCEEYGKVTECTIMRSKTVKDQNYAFVHFEDESCAKGAVLTLDGSDCHGATLKAELSFSKQQNQHGPPVYVKEQTVVRTKLFVANLPQGVSKEELEELFKQYGTLSECDIVKNYAFVHFEDEKEAKTAVLHLDGSDFKGSKIKVELSVSRVRQRPGMGNRNACYKCGQAGHWYYECPNTMETPYRDRGFGRGGRGARGGRGGRGGGYGGYDNYMESDSYYPGPGGGYDDPYAARDPYMRDPVVDRYLDRVRPYDDPYIRRRAQSLLVELERLVGGVAPGVGDAGGYYDRPGPGMSRDPYMDVASRGFNRGRLGEDEGFGNIIKLWNLRKI